MIIPRPIIVSLKIFFLILLGAFLDVGQPRERMSPIVVVAGGLILSGILSFFLLFLIHIYAAIFFFVFLIAFMVYFLYEPKLKPGVSVVMSATLSRKVYDFGNSKSSYE